MKKINKLRSVKYIDLRLKDTKDFVLLSHDMKLTKEDKLGLLFDTYS